MKQINYIMVIKSVGEDFIWEETMVELVNDYVTSEQRASEIVNNYNQTLRLNEKARELISVRNTVQTENVILKHSWEKTSLVTEIGGYDKYKCKVCGVTGKRYGLNENIIIDSKFKKKVNCSGKS